MESPQKIAVAGAGVVGLLIVMSLGLAGVRAHRSAAAPQPSSSTAALDPNIDQISLIRFASNPQPIPPFLTNDVYGDIISTAALRGKVVIVNFWATWCPPCREEIPSFIKLADKYKDKLVIVGVSMDDSNRREIADFVAQQQINYPVVMASHELVAEYGGVPALPTSFIISPDGHVVQKHIGLYKQAEYEAEIRTLLGMPVKAKVETFEDTGQIFLKNAELATDLPDVDMSALTPEQKQEALKRMNSQLCTCGCGLTVAQCRINDETCETSKKLGNEIVKQVASGTPAKPQPSTD